MKREELESLLPHRDIALCIERAGLFGNKEVRCIYSIGEDDPKIKGHFPKESINPGHWLIEAMALSGALLVKLTRNTNGALPLFREVESKFYSKISPPARIFISPKLINNDRRGRIFIFEVSATQNGRRVATAKIKGVIDQ